MIGLIIFLIIIAALLALIEAALLTYVFDWGEFRQTLVFSALANFFGTGIGGRMWVYAAVSTFVVLVASTGIVVVSSLLG